MQIIKEIRLSRTEERLLCTSRQPNGTYKNTYKDLKVNCVGVIRTQTYAKSFAYISSLVAAAKADWTHLTDDDIRLVYFGGDRYARTFGIEFDLPDTTVVPEGYKAIQELELTK